MKKNNRGFSMLEAMIAIGVTGVVIVGATVIMEMQNKMQRTANTFGWLDQLRSEVIVAIKKKSSWDAMVADNRNPSLACLRPRLTDPKAVINCMGASGAINAITGVDQKLIMDTTNIQTGFDIKGQTCSGFGTDACLLRYTISWVARCAGGAADDGCSNPDVIISADLKYAGGSVPMNTMLYNFSFMIPHQGESLDASCEQGLLGVFDPATKKCKMNLNNICTQPNEFLVGFNSDGSPVCQQRTVIKSGCGAGTILSGVNSDGSPICTSNTCI